MGQYFVELRNKWNSEPEFILAAYALWRLCWIHPFEDGNGRTARAVAYLIICLKKGQWLPGTDTVLHKIKLHKESYSAALRHADASHSAGIADVIPLAVLLAQHTAEQLR